MGNERRAEIILRNIEIISNADSEYWFKYGIFSQLMLICYLRFNGNPIRNLFSCFLIQSVIDTKFILIPAVSSSKGK